MGIALREIGSGQVVVLLRTKTSDVKSTIVPNNPKRESEGVKVVSVPGEDNIRIRAVGFRELRGENAAGGSELPSSDVWEFRVVEQHPETKTEVFTLWYVLGADILCLMTMSKVI
jgi:hypothetical protein